MLAQPVWPQGTGSVSGTLLASGASFACLCEVTLELPGGHAVASAFLDSAGNFKFTNVRPGSYVIRATIDGFKEVQHPVDVSAYHGFGKTLIHLDRQIPVARVESKPGNDPHIVDVSQFLDGYPKEAVKLYRKAGEKQKKGKIDDAITDLEAAVRVAPDFYQAHNDLGLLYKEKGRIDEAEREFRLASELNKQSAEPLINLTSLYIDRNEPELAVATGEKAIELNSRSGPAFFSLGIALYRISKLDRAEAALKKALELTPKMGYIRLMLANVYLKMRNYNGLSDQLDRYLAENPEGEQRAQVEQMRQQLQQAKGGK
jgi:tetratricopeptide (TPR) repeat protein